MLPATVAVAAVVAVAVARQIAATSPVLVSLGNGADGGFSFRPRGPLVCGPNKTLFSSLDGGATWAPGLHSQALAGHTGYARFICCVIVFRVCVYVVLLLL